MDLPAPLTSIQWIGDVARESEATGGTAAAILLGSIDRGVVITVPLYSIQKRGV